VGCPCVFGCWGLLGALAGASSLLGSLERPRPVLSLSLCLSVPLSLCRVDDSCNAFLAPPPKKKGAGAKRARTD
jgi:hypothetical protein